MAGSILIRRLMLKGKIIKGIAGFYYVDTVESGIYACKAKGIFRKLGKKPLVGDDVEIEITHEKDREGSLVAIAPRVNELIRPAAANVEQALILFALKSPDPNLVLLDRFLISMDMKGIHSAICFNKQDLAREDEKENLRDTYSSCGYRVFFSSFEEGEGIQELKEFMAGKTTLLAGPSGVGKSTLTNACQSNVHMETGEIRKNWPAERTRPDMPSSFRAAILLILWTHPVLRVFFWKVSGKRNLGIIMRSLPRMRAGAGSMDACTFMNRTAELRRRWKPDLLAVKGTRTIV